MFELLEEMFDRFTRAVKVASCIGFAGYVAWKSNAFMPESYGDLAIPAVMALFVAALLCIAGSLVNQYQQHGRKG